LPVFGCPTGSEPEQNLTYLQVWNKIPMGQKNAGKISFVAEIHIKGLQALAMYILRELSNTDLAERYEGIDPIRQFDNDWEASP
jgi:hypothetical protein